MIQCLECDKLLPSRQTPRQIHYCSNACRQKAYRKRNGSVQQSHVPSQRVMDLIFCAGDNEKFFEIAHRHHYLLGIRSGRATYGYPIRFVDIKYREPNFEKHLKAVQKHRPKYAIVPDLSEEKFTREDVSRALAQYDVLAPYCEIPLIVPKLPGQIALLPRSYAIGYSVESSYGAAKYPLWELEGRRIHLLGGSPHRQMELYQSLSQVAEVISVDGNMAMSMARNFSRYWGNGQWNPHPLRGKTKEPLYLDCWEQSCINIRHAWSCLSPLST